MKTLKKSFTALQQKTECVNCDTRSLYIIGEASGNWLNTDSVTTFHICRFSAANFSLDVFAMFDDYLKSNKYEFFSFFLYYPVCLHSDAEKVTPAFIILSTKLKLVNRCSSWGKWVSIRTTQGPIESFNDFELWTMIPGCETVPLGAHVV